MKAVISNDEVYVAFVNGNNKVTPKTASTIPKLELCCATETVLAAQKTYYALKTEPDEVFLE